ncbi:serine/threonine-protein phosphatase 6 regulatory ankyrin repeat subunit A-like isoform X2 [Phymastichus coffea]|uniref:serine/threonine-protein phosphatase 6 regulatory ankyrin repeat subunit A-like isoform X2 n=1 Tax=Phymastichus coffea TaxID=108790 RepID=UPI00273C68FC|nr:serine/threonine-protein phosphatase 6 regulatory ankyrin repeat subunit A-like isoform X2 [Phymastichus coffea]
MPRREMAAAGRDSAEVPRDAIHAAVADGNADLVEELLGSGISPNLQNRQGDTPLHVASRSGDSMKIDSTVRLAMLKLLWEGGAAMNARGPRKETALHVAVKSQLVDVVDFLLRSGAVANCRDRDERTPLHLCASASDDSEANRRIVDLLLRHGGNFHAQDCRWKDPLVEAVCSGNASVAELLLRAGARVDHVNRLGLSAIFYACETQSVTMVELLLLGHRASVGIRDRRKRSTALHFAAGSGRYYTFGDDSANRSDAIAKLLLDAGARVDAADVDKSTALHIAVDTKDRALVEVLLDAGADVDAKDDYGNTPLHVLLFTAQEHNCNEARLERIAKLLVDKGANVNERNNNLETPFHYAVWRGNPTIASSFLKNGANVGVLWHAQKASFKFLHETPACNTPEKCGDNVDEAFTPLNVAVKLGHVKLVNLLLDRGDVDVETSNVTDSHAVTKTSLYFATKNGHYEVVKLLLDAGCLINSTSRGCVPRKRCFSLSAARV